MSRTMDHSLYASELKQQDNTTLAAISKHVPRLADFHRADKSSLVSRNVVRGLARLADFLIATLVGIAIATTYVGLSAFSSELFYPSAILFVGLATVALLEIFGLNRIERYTNTIAQLPRIALAWTLAFLVLIAGVFFFKVGIEFSRVWLATWFIVGGSLLLSFRIALGSVVRRWQSEGRLYRKAVIFGSGPVMQNVLKELEADSNGDVRIAGIFDDRKGERTSDLIEGYPNLGTLQELVEFARKTRIDLIILALPMKAEERIQEALRALFALPVAIKIPARATSLHMAPHTYSRIGHVPMIDICDKPITDWGSVTKWAFDKVIACVALILLAPLMAAVAIAIKLDSPGPVFFRQRRYGLNNELIEIFKFRSMHTALSDATAEKLVTKDDPRVTKVGRFIRKTSIDELPQLLNVLLGDLSLVGPRPHALQAKAENRLYDDVVENYFARHKVKPGITGWAQINGWRGETDTKEKIEKRVEHDLYYIENWSVFLDLYILLKTPLALFETESAY